MITLADHQGKTVDKHLSFKKGETIMVRGQKDVTWYSGQLHGKVRRHLEIDQIDCFAFRLDGFHAVMFDPELK